MSPGATLLIMFAGPHVASDLPAAIVDRFNATAGLDFVAGGLTYGLARTDEDTYAEFHAIGAGPYRWTTGRDYVKTVTYQFNCYGPSDDVAERMTEALVDAFNHKMARLAWAGGTSTMANPGASIKDTAEYPAASGARLRRMHTDFAFTVNRSLP